MLHCLPWAFQNLTCAVGPDPLRVPLRHLPLLQAPWIYQNIAQHGEMEIGAWKGKTQRHKLKCKAEKKETTKNQQSISMRVLKNSLPLTLIPSLGREKLHTCSECREGCNEPRQE